MKASECCDVLIAGAGPAGASLAITLAKAGRQVLLVEKKRDASHKVCGEFLSPENLPFLNSLGIDVTELGAQAIHSVRIVEREILAEALLPEPAFSITRKKLDEALLSAAQTAGATLLRGCGVETLKTIEASNAAQHWQADLTGSTNDRIFARHAFLATGKHDMRGWTRSTQGTHHSLVAMKMYFVLSQEQSRSLAGHVEILLYPGGYAGLQPVEGGAVNLCALITREKLRSLGGRWEDFLNHMQQSCPHLARRLCGAAPLLERPLALSAIPYGYRAPLQDTHPSLWRVGDQAAVIPSFCGDGIAIAFHTAALVSQLFLQGSTPETFQRVIRQQFRTRLHCTALLSRLLIGMPAAARVVKIWPSLLPAIFSATRLPPSPRTNMDFCQGSGQFRRSL